MSDSTNTIETFANQEYKWGFVTEIDSESIPRGLSEDVIRLISAKKNEPEFLLEWRLKAYRQWLTMKEPKWANVHYPRSIIRTSSTMPRRRPKRTAHRAWTRSIPELLRTYAKLGIPLREQELLAGVAVDAVFDSVSVATTFKEKLADMGIIFCSFSEAVQEHPELVQKYLGSVVPHFRQLLRRPELRGFQRRFVLLHSQGRALPDGAVHLLPHQCQGHRAVRAHPDHRRRRRLRQLPRRLHGADARQQPVACRRGGAGRARQRPDQVFDRAELVSRRQRRQGRDLQLRDQARQMPGRQFEDLLDPGGDRLGHHLEVPELSC